MKTKQRLILAFLAALTLFVQSVKAADTSKPNILFIFNDDQRADTIP